MPVLQHFRFCIARRPHVYIIVDNVSSKKECTAPYFINNVVIAVGAVIEFPSEGNQNNGRAQFSSKTPYKSRLSIKMQDKRRIQEGTDHVFLNSFILFLFNIRSMLLLLKDKKVTQNVDYNREDYQKNRQKWQTGRIIGFFRHILN